MRFTLPRLRLPFIVISRERYNEIRSADAQEHFRAGYEAAEEMWKPKTTRRVASKPKKTRP